MARAWTRPDGRLIQHSVDLYMTGHVSLVERYIIALNGTVCCKIPCVIDGYGTIRGTQRGHGGMRPWQRACPFCMPHNDLCRCAWRLQAQGGA